MKLVFSLYVSLNTSKNYIVVLKKLPASLTSLHATKGSPDVPVGQVHVGMWLITSQVAAWPHVPGQGSTHRWLLHALLRGQSEFIVHSGLQLEYGSPK